jgi:pre-mRNA-splicing factor SYF1
MTRKLAEVVEDDNFQSLAGKSKHQLWLDLCDVITKHPCKAVGLDVDAILRGGIQNFCGEVGQLWTSLADFYIRTGLFEKARDVYEEGVATAVTIRDFSLIFDAYTQFEESVLSAKLESIGREQTVTANSRMIGSLTNSCTEFFPFDGEAEVDLRLARVEHLIGRRPELLSAVMLRQNPHNTPEWQKRISLFEGDPTKQILTFTEAVKTVDPRLALGKPHVLWINFAKFYELHGDVDNARIVLEKAACVPFVKIDDLASIWCEWAELELRQKNYHGALTLLRRATSGSVKLVDPHLAHADSVSAQDGICKSQKLWKFYCDLEESFGSIESSKAAYARMFEARVATPQTVLNFAHLLLEHKCFDECFRVFERGVHIFKFPHSREIWVEYLKHFVQHFGAKKLERARDLYEQCCDAVPPKDSKYFFLEYARLEEKHGLGRRAMEIYDRACDKLPVNEKLGMYDVYISRAMELFGVVKVRSIYETAIAKKLSDQTTKSLCTRYARLECKLGEIARARSLYTHASQFASPQCDTDFWEEWNRFEVRYGDEDTFREMLRVKRSVSANFVQMHFTMNTSDVTTAVGTSETGVVGVHDGINTLDVGNVHRAGNSEVHNTVPPSVTDSVTELMKSADERCGHNPTILASHTDNPDEIDISDG